MESAAEESRKRKREEYEMQLLFFHSRAVYATLKIIVMERIQSTSRKLCEALENSYKISNSETSATLKMNEKKLVKAYYAASEPYLNNIESIVNKSIAVPDNVLLDEDKLQATQYAETECEIMRKKLDELQQRAKRATILETALKEELQLIEQSSIYADNIDRLSHITENSASCPDITNKLHQLAKDYKRFSLSLDDKAPSTLKSRYNTIDNLQCIDDDDL